MAHTSSETNVSILRIGIALLLYFHNCRCRATMYTSLDSLRVALGRIQITFLKCCSHSRPHSRTPGPSNTLAAKFPPGSRTPRRSEVNNCPSTQISSIIGPTLPERLSPRASLSAVSARSNDRSTSKFPEPLVDGAMSESTDWNPPGWRDRISAVCSSVTSPTMVDTRLSQCCLGMMVSFRSTPRTRPPHFFAGPNALHATCSHAPGLHPRSNTLPPRVISW
mmetsp:Transcript_37305/g.71508  ORF Transcript_37305/g.71508 Transcript_37305/m.71508 type:complete len:222 (+) Transcript_37305:188-853(+)